MKDFHAYMIKYETNTQYELALECLHISLAMNKKKYSKLKSEKIFCVDLFDCYNDKYLYERNFTKYRKAKKAYNYLKKFKAEEVF